MIEDMFIAMYFSGRITAYEDYINKLLEFKKNNNVVFFCSLNCADLSENEKAFMRHLEIKEKQIQFQKVVYPEWVYKLHTAHHTVTRETVYSQFLNNNICFKLIEKYESENNVTFDCIIKFRADIMSDNVFTIDKLEDNTIYVPQNYDWSGLNDQIAYGNKDVMRIYSTLIDRILLFCNNKETAYHPETLTLKNMNYHKIIIKRVMFPYTLNPKRKK